MWFPTLGFNQEWTRKVMVWSYLSLFRYQFWFESEQTSLKSY